MQSADSIPESIIQLIHKSAVPCKLVLAMAGNGTQAISELMRYGNGSATLLTQHLLYDNAAFDRYIGGKPDKYVSPQASRQLAMAAYVESRTISRDAYPTAGIGCTSSLVKPDGEREGRSHLIFVSTQDATHTRTVCVTLASSISDDFQNPTAVLRYSEEPNRTVTKPAHRDSPSTDNIKAMKPSLIRSRVQEEWINAVAILQAVAKIRGASTALDPLLAAILTHSDRVEIQESSPVDAQLSQVLHGARSAWAIGDELPDTPHVIFAGSFNPLHSAHLRLFDLAMERTGLPGVFELSITNVDKPPMDFLEIQTRLRQFAQRNLPVVVTNRPRYLEKTLVFPKRSTFVMGSDTFARLVDAEYYNPGETPLETFEETGTHFLVACRKLGDGTVISGEAILQNVKGADQFNRWSNITTCLPVSDFLMDLSSTDIRTGRTANG